MWVVVLCAPRWESVVLCFGINQWLTIRRVISTNCIIEPELASQGRSLSYNVRCSAHTHVWKETTFLCLNQLETPQQLFTSRVWSLNHSACDTFFPRHLEYRMNLGRGPGKICDAWNLKIFSGSRDLTWPPDVLYHYHLTSHQPALHVEESRGS